VMIDARSIIRQLLAVFESELNVVERAGITRIDGVRDRRNAPRKERRNAPTWGSGISGSWAWFPLTVCDLLSGSYRQRLE
jgi:hypothetical protein